MKCPCKSCEKVGCGSYHDKCHAYSEWRAFRDEVNRKKADHQELKALSRDHEMKYRKNLRKGWRNK